MDLNGLHLGRIALVHDWIDSLGGAESTFLEMALALPQADLYALTMAPSFKRTFADRTVRTTWLDRNFLRSNRALTLPLMSPAWRSLRTGRRYDLIVTSVHALAREFALGRSDAHLCYTYTPLRYVWTPQIDGRGSARLLKPARAALKRLDRRTVASVDSFASISNEVAARVSEFYGRASVVIPPPVDTGFFNEGANPRGQRGDYLLSVGRFVPYKRHDLVIEAGALLGAKVVIAGSGPDERRLRELAARLPNSQVDFHVAPTREKVRDLMRGARLFVFPSFEDFGIVPVEAQACGTPVVAFGRGGSLDTVIPGRTGLLVGTQSASEFASGIASCDGLQLSKDDCRQNAERFSQSEFRGRFLAWTQEYSPASRST